MTTPTSFSENKCASANRRFFNARYFMFQLKTGWPIFVGFALLFILCMVIPGVSYITSSFEGVTDMVRYTKDAVSEVLYTLGIFNVVVSMGCGFLCGLNVMRFTNNKVAVNFYHSLPMRRESIFITSTLQGFLYYVVAYGAAIAIMFAAFVMRFGSLGFYLVRPAVLTFGYGVLFFLLVYSMTLFASSLTGTGLMRFIGTGYVIFLPIALFMSFMVAVGSCGLYREIIDTDYYLTPENLTWLCAPLRLENMVCDNDRGTYVMFDSPFSAEVLIVAAITVVMFALAFVLYLRRPSEGAAKPVIWKSAAFVFKYSSAFIGGTIFSLMFYGMFGTYFWLLVGTVLGSFITFLVVNGILSKSARAIFKGIRGFAVFTAIMVIVAVVFYMDAFGIFAKVPSASLVGEVEVTVDYSTVATYKGDDVERVVELIDKAHKNSDSLNGYPDVEYFYDYSEDVYVPKEYGETMSETLDSSLYSSKSYDRIVIHAVFKTKLGIPYAVRITSDCEAAKELASYVYETTVDKIAIPTASEITGGDIYLYIENHNKSYARFNTKATNAELIRYIDMLDDPMGIKGDSPIVGCINVYPKDEYYKNHDNYRLSSTYLITAKDIDVLNKLNLGEPLESDDDVIDLFIEDFLIESICVVDNATEKYRTINDPEKVHEFVKAIYSFETYGQEAAVCTKDHGYNVFLRPKNSEVTFYQHLNFRDDIVSEELKKMFEN